MRSILTSTNFAIIFKFRHNIHRLKPCNKSLHGLNGWTIDIWMVSNADLAGSIASNANSAGSNVGVMLTQLVLLWVILTQLVLL